MREAWTDERLDDLRDGMHRQFDQVHAEIRELRATTDARFDALNARFDALNARFDALNRTLFLGAASIVVSVLGAVLAKGVF